MKISVIIPTYKPQNYLWECLDSLCKQSFPKDCYEIVLVLNGCCEPYNSQILNYISENNQVNWVYSQIDQGGVSHARNIALDKSCGDYITFIDDDDFVSPGFLSGLYEVASHNTVALCYPYCFIDEKFSEQLKYGPTYEFERYNIQEKVTIVKARKYFAGPWMKLIHKDIIGDRRYDERFKNSEDTLFMFLISDKVENCRFTSRDSIYYRRWREESAFMKKKSRVQFSINSIKAIIMFLRYYMINPKNYSGLFLATRILGQIKTIIKNH